jgi:hypothetical protein
MLKASSNTAELWCKSKHCTRQATERLGLGSGLGLGLGSGLGLGLGLSTAHVKQPCPAHPYSPVVYQRVNVDPIYRLHCRVNRLQWWVTDIMVRSDQQESSPLSDRHRTPHQMHRALRVIRGEANPNTTESKAKTEHRTKCTEHCRSFSNVKGETAPGRTPSVLSNRAGLPKDKRPLPISFCNTFKSTCSRSASTCSVGDDRLHG